MNTSLPRCAHEYNIKQRANMLLIVYTSLGVQKQFCACNVAYLLKPADLHCSRTPSRAHTSMPGTWTTQMKTNGSPTGGAEA